MQDYYEFLRDLRAGLDGIGQPISAEAGAQRLAASQVKRMRGKNFMTDEKFGYRLCNGSEFGPCVVEISHGVFINKRLIGLTVFHLDPRHREQDDELSTCFDTIEEAAGRLRALNGEDA